MRVLDVDAEEGPVATRLSYLPEGMPNLQFKKPLSLPAQQDATNGERIIERLSSAALHLQLLEYYAPPSVVINEEYEIIHTSEKAGRYFQIAGEPSMNLLKIIRSELRLELRTALYQAVQRKTDVEISELMKGGGAVHCMTGVIHRK